METQLEKLKRLARLNGEEKRPDQNRRAPPASASIDTTVAMAALEARALAAGIQLALAQGRQAKARRRRLEDLGIELAYARRANQM